MPWGEHKGKAICDVPRSYLTWMRGLEDLAPELAAQVQSELRRRGERHVDAGTVIGDLDEEMTKRIAEDPEVSHEVAGRVNDHWLDVVEEIRQRHGIGEETTLVIPPQREPDCRKGA